ncbi:MAG: tetratricopeptide repeat protein [Pseudomonadota bacterium]|nr:tetratricopeptide repeat protein [Pseudomonadota bacterium]
MTVSIGLLAAAAAGGGMAEPEKNFLQQTIDWLSSVKTSFDQMRERIGWPSAVLLILLATGSVIWWQSDHIAKLPGVEPLHAWVNERALPIAPAGRLTIAVAHLDNDKDRQHERLLLHGLRQFEGVEVQQVDRTIKWPAADSESEAEKKAEETARGLLKPGLLKKTRADVLIWGSVESFNNQSLMKLYWTPARDVPGAKFTKEYQTETIALPPAFWSDLKQILGLLTQSRIAAFTVDYPGHFVAGKLAPLIAQVRALVQSKEGVWNPETLAGVRFSLAHALALDGEQSGKNEPLAESIALFRKVLEENTRARVPLQWAAAENNLGGVLQTLGGRENDTARLDEAVTAFREALQEFTRARVPLRWAGTQNNLGIALATLGEQENDTARLDESVTTFREALQEFTRERVPLDWAVTQMNLGNVLRTLGERENDTARLDEAVTAFREALKETTRERAPRGWAMIQRNLGIALATLGERERAVTAFREALKETTRERAPRDWAMIQWNLGNSLEALGERESGTARLEEAVSAYREALQEWTRARVPLDWARTQMNLALVYGALAAETGKRVHLDDALEAVGGALEEYNKAKAAYYVEKAGRLRAVLLAMKDNPKNGAAQK